MSSKIELINVSCAFWYFWQTAEGSGGRANKIVSERLSEVYNWLFGLLDHEKHIYRSSHAPVFLHYFIRGGGILWQKIE